MLACRFVLLFNIKKNAVKLLPDVRRVMTKGKVKVTLQQAVKAQRGSRGIALLFL
jgi:hypothetical protein